MWSILTPRRKVPISTIYLRRHPERSRGIPRRYLEAFATGSMWHRDEEFVGQARCLPLNSIGRRERLPYTKCKKSGHGDDSSCRLVGRDSVEPLWLRGAGALPDCNRRLGSRAFYLS